MSDENRNEHEVERLSLVDTALIESDGKGEVKGIALSVYYKKGMSDFTFYPTDEGPKAWIVADMMRYLADRMEKGSPESAKKINEEAVRRIDTAKTLAQLADILMSVPGVKAVWADFIIARAAKLGEDDMAARIGKGLASLAVKS